jgi:hypothetical protein
LKFQRLNDLSFVQSNRFQKLHEEGSKGVRSDPLVLEDLDWENEWIDHNAQPVYEGADITWAQVDEAIGASVGPMCNLRNRGSGSQAVVTMTYSRRQVGEDDEEDAHQEVVLEDYSTSEDDQERDGGEGEAEDEERGNGEFDDDLLYN